MKVLILSLFFFFSFLSLSSTLEEDTVAEDIGVHQQERLVELLTSQECEDLLFALSHPEENIFQHLERLSAEKNQLDVKPRAKRDTSSAADSEAQCRTALTGWLLRYGEQTYYDRLSRALQHIGRTDIAIVLLIAPNVTSRHLSVSVDERELEQSHIRGTRSWEERQPGQNPQPETFC